MPEQASPKNTKDNTGNAPALSIEVQEVISKKPAWVVRNGMILFLVIFAVIFATTFFIKYPDVVSANARLTSINAPKEIRANTEGRLIRLFAKEGQNVEQGEILGFLESRAAHNEVISLSQIIDTIQRITENNPELLPKYCSVTYKNLGELQPSYQVFMQALNNFRQYLSSGYYIKEKGMLMGDLQFLERLHNILNTQKEMDEQDLTLANKNFDASKSLSNDKVIAAVEFRNEQSKLIAKQMTIPQINTALVNNESNRHEKEKEIAKLENEIAQQKGIFQQALNTLKAQVDDWKNKYLLIAPIPGRLAFADTLEEQVEIKLGQTICYINPGNAMYYATVLIPQNNFGKIRRDEKVLLKLTAYPYREFGTVTGKLSFVSSIATDSGFTAKIILPQGLATNYNKQLTYREGLSAQAEIITQEQNLSDRIFYSIRSIFKN